MSRFTIEEFVQQTAQDSSADDYFTLESDRMLEVNLEGLVWMKAGAMVAYVGQMKFTREGLLDKGLGTLLKRSVTGEGAKLTKAEGKGRLYLADSGKTIKILKLQGESIIVNGSDLLALEPTIDWEIKMMKKLAVVQAAFLPMLATSSFFGQNFSVLPVDSSTVFWGTLAVNALVTGGLLYLWRKK